MSHEQTVIDYLTHRARPRILERFRERSCIASTRIAMEVCRRHGIECWPQAVKVEALNARAVESQREGTNWAVGSFSLAVEGTGSYTFEAAGMGDWDGHLVLMFRDSRPGDILLDLSADQMDRPQHGLRVTGPVVFRLTDGWPSGIYLEGGGLLAYDRIKSKAYRQARDWAMRDRWEPVVEAIEEDLRCLTG